MSTKQIIIKGAKEHNLKNIDLTIPKDKLIVFTGISGSGKSTLAMDTIYAEGQRRYMESLSSYARQFLGQMEKPNVDSIDGLSPAISIDQKTTSKNPRSTVGTITEVNDYLRLLYARIGKVYCPNHNIEIKGQTVGQIKDQIFKTYQTKKILVLSKIASQKKGTFKDTLDELRLSGFSRVIINGKLEELDEEIILDKNKKHTIYIVVDRMEINDENESRLYDDIELATEKGNGSVSIQIFNETQIEEYSLNNACTICGFSVSKIEPTLFGFNTPFGACSTCAGLGVEKRVSMDLVVKDKELSLNEGAIDANGFRLGTYYFANIVAICKQYKIDMNKPYKKLTKKEVNYIAYGSDVELPIYYEFNSGEIYKRVKIAEGVVTNMERRYLETNSSSQRDDIEKSMVINDCHACKGSRLNESAMSVKVNHKNIDQIARLSIEESYEWINDLNKHLSKTDQDISNMIIKEITSRLSFLNNVGLNYLSLARTAGTLSGGEAQRIRLASQIGSKLSGVLYVLDEPSIGLHQRDNEKLIKTLKHMRDIGNTLIVVEHDEDTMLNADYIVEIGPRAGLEGGSITFKGTPAQIKKSKCLTGLYLANKISIDVPIERKKPEKGYIKITGATENNLKNINVEIPIGLLNVITGVSGSGKSTLINQILLKELSNKLHRTKILSGKHKEITGIEEIDKVISIDQSPIGRTPRSNPATYTGVFDDIRDLFANTAEAKAKGYLKGRFSFNVRGGRCEHCQGDGQIKIEMHFLPDVFVPCDVCNSKRYNEETLQIRYKGKNIYEVLDLTISDAVVFFKNLPKIKTKLDALMNVGLGYIKLGQSSVTLSGGEAQRVKLASELYKKSTGKTIYILDEPSTGLHFDDIRKLIEVIQKLTNDGNTVVIIEHDLDIIKVADYIIDLGPEGGEKGGKVIAKGTPEEVVKVKESFTGKFLKGKL